MNQKKKILVIRNDKIGDFMLAWPSFKLLKTQYPEAEVTALVPAYTADLASACEWIDKVLIDNKNSSFIKDIYTLYKIIKANNYDCSISLFSEARTSIALFLACVKQRIGPATKLAQLFLNRRLKQKRSLSVKPEYQYNIDLVRYCIELNNDKPVDPPEQPYMKFDASEIEKVKNKLLDKHRISNTRKLIFIHPGTGGSAINLSTDQYADVIQQISDATESYFIITSGPGETAIAKQLSLKLKNVKHHVHNSTTGIIDFCKLISCADLFISGSTGPLHIAGALNIPTAAFYPARKSATSLRWQTLNSNDRRSAFSPDKYTGENDMKQINIKKSAEMIITKHLA